MSGEKTEQPTGKKLSQARSQGQVARSQDLNRAVVLVAAALVFWFGGKYFAASMLGLISGDLHRLVDSGFDRPLTRSGFTALLQHTIEASILMLLPFGLTIAALGTAINFAQVGFHLSFKPLQPNLSKINPIPGTKRFFSMTTTVETLKSLLKMTLIGSMVASIIWGNHKTLLSTASMDIQSAVMAVSGILSQLVGWAIFWFLILGGGDWFYQRYAFLKQLRMSKQDIKDEHKDADGDPNIKARIRAAGRQIVSKRQLAAVPMADVVITNPTHFAIALQYDPDIAPAPRVIAKGVDHFAQKIKEVAKENGVPMVENRPLARTLYDQVDLDRMITPELFVAVAEVLALVYAQQGGRRKSKS
ncbi:MAG: flagellar biosynthesis protein FlhB [Vampirovibrionales bacterium]|nr:flagellar biosynthesis protein FlhB [Vampirovibrionales bacterium]